MSQNLYKVPNHYSADSGRYDNAPFRNCGKSGLKMSPVSLGMWHNFGAINDFHKSRDIVLTAFDNGIVCFDLANNYGPPYGSAEETFGKIMKDDLKPYRDELFIASKAGYDMWPGPYGKGGSRKYLLNSLDQSLQRMNIYYVDVFYHHCMDPETPLEESMGALVHAVKSGKAIYAGISNYSPEKAAMAFDLLEKEGIHCLVEQSAYNLLNRSVEDSGLVNLLVEKGVGLAAFSPLAQGLLTGKYNNGIPADSRANSSSKFLSSQNITPEVIAKVSALAKLAGERGQTMSRFALNWLLSMPSVATVLVGASSTAQLLENNKAAYDAKMTESELCEIDKLLAQYS